MLQVHAYIEAAVGTGQDRILWLDGEDMIALALADGAGGMGGGTLAAETAIKAVIDSLYESEQMLNEPQWARLMLSLDKLVSGTRHAGETTLIALQADAEQVCGASAGDSEAWIVEGNAVRVLTSNQHRKPLLGTNESVPVPFAAELRGGVLVVASDGLFRFATTGKIVETIRQVSLPGLPRALVDLTRLRSGKLHDDAAVLVAAECPSDGRENHE